MNTLAAPASVAAASQALAQWLDQMLEAHPPVPGLRCRVELVNHQELATHWAAEDSGAPVLFVLLHRAAPSMAARMASTPLAARGGTASLPALVLDLHYLLIPQAAQALPQQQVLDRTLRAVHQAARLPGTELQCVLEDMPAEAWTRLLAALPGCAGLALPCVVRGLQLAVDEAPRGAQG